MLCKLCYKNDANKKNTHYLTDAIIRTCLNEDGSNEREKGYYFDISNTSPYVTFNFQRGTSVQKLEESLGRIPTDEEIERAKEIPYSVDYIFCSDCEKIFTEIENPFVTQILPKFRNEDLTKKNEITFEENKIIKLFFYLQIWRTSICESDFNLNPETEEALRTLLLNSNTTENVDLPQFPIHITYLETIGDEKVYTSNFVGTTNDRNPNIIFMNDFVIQFFEDENLVKKIEFYGLNESNDLQKFINIKNDEFKFKILRNEKRLEILDNIARKEKVQKAVTFLAKEFSQKWVQIFRGLPNVIILGNYLNYMTDGDFDILKYDEQTIKSKTDKFIQELINKNR